MSQPPDFETMAHDPRDPNPWLALYLDHSTPIDQGVKGAWLRESSSWSRQFLLPVVRPLARGIIIFLQTHQDRDPQCLHLIVAAAPPAWRGRCTPLCGPMLTI